MSVAARVRCTQSPSPRPSTTTAAPTTTVPGRHTGLQLRFLGRPPPYIQTESAERGAEETTLGGSLSSRFSTQQTNEATRTPARAGALISRRPGHGVTRVGLCQYLQHSGARKARLHKRSTKHYKTHWTWTWKNTVLKCSSTRWHESTVTVKKVNPRQTHVPSRGQNHTESQFKQALRQEVWKHAEQCVPRCDPRHASRTGSNASHIRFTCSQCGTTENARNVSASILLQGLR